MDALRTSERVAWLSLSIEPLWVLPRLSFAECSGHGDRRATESCEEAAGDCKEACECSDVPPVCPQICNPVWGCNELTIDNVCFAARQGVTAAISGDGGRCPFDTPTDCVFQMAPNRRGRPAGVPLWATDRIVSPTAIAGVRAAGE